MLYHAIFVKDFYVFLLQLGPSNWAVLQRIRPLGQMTFSFVSHERNKPPGLVLFLNSASAANRLSALDRSRS
jgi:hypothetical protein